MQWNQMTKTQQNAARRLRDKLAAAGIADATVSQVAKYFDESILWELGEITRSALCESTGWTPPPADEPQTTAEEADELGRAITAKISANEALKAAIVAEHARGSSANEVARRLDGVISRPVVLEMLGAASIRERATKALLEAGFDDYDVSISDAPGRRVTIQLWMQGSTAERWNAAANIINVLREAGLILTRDGSSTLGMQEYVGEGNTASVCDR